MSWSIFKQSILNQAKSPDSIQSIDEVARLYAREYDAAIRRGGDMMNHISIQKGNVESMEQMFKFALQNGLNQQSTYNLVQEMGKGVLIYWTGAPMMQFPTPIMPAIGAFANIATVSASCTNPGKWDPIMPPPPPVNDSSLIIDQFIAYATMHLTTVSGMISTISLYPPLGTPAPGIVMWNGYKV